jgi:hypothetical protein
MFVPNPHQPTTSQVPLLKLYKLQQQKNEAKVKQNKQAEAIEFA